MVTKTETDVAAYWRALAEARGRKLEELRALLVTVVDGLPDAHLRAFVSALDTSRPSWLRELDEMPSTTELQRAEILAVLDELWRQVAADPGK
ncbi:MAG: hypothetical protein JOZ54_12495 [Acidobacteria bacterium]|nr:hypothetical protein [Acidobacteriota bacterium]